MSHKRKSNALIRLIVLAVVFGFYFLYRQMMPGHILGDEIHAAQNDIPTDSLLLTITNPNAAEQLLPYKAMLISFNREHHIPNWVAWELTADETTGTEPRAKGFTHDDRAEGSAWPDDYKNSGYSRGHMAPAADMKWDKEAMRESFLMSNVVPQSNSLNSGAWQTLENKCRTWAQADSAIIIICGPVIEPGLDEWIGATAVTVPRRFFKVVLSPNVRPMRAIGFIMDNGRVKGGMQAAAVSVDSVERLTGHNFFSALPDSIECQVEAEANFNRWPN